MQVRLSDYNTRLQSAATLDQQMDCALLLATGLGFDAVVYDYSPVPVSHDGALITPTLLTLRNTPADWHTLWCRQGYYQIDPVQQLAVNSVSPFVWSYQPKAQTVLQTVIKDFHKPVVRYLQDSHMTCGLTVPIHMPKGGFATLTGLRLDNSDTALEDARQGLADFGLLAHAFQEVAYPLFDQSVRSCSTIKLTRRERECLCWSAEGLTAKEIAHQLNRSVATVTLHLNSAMQKLGAKNRVQAVVRAVHYRLLDN
ncbi:LuxR family transcriptional regulator [Pseudomonas sp. CDFA 602]|uniref:LuxR family transcriptional regulator n=1 Tax=Pseudomonas californiensis TaxID=2829823 RepID=UPI001E3F1890|nr:LuxR family transcriptional regulator [Pseudomonas californiensis]MCD5996621.1 LuxR family transcriptional regulator [Pseudomonas californiensis]MCD6002202.1 LuxR family transcriptional regulator [Pseudomonas californiensis]